MAKQMSFLKIEGTIQDLSFYKGPEGTYYVRSKGGVSKNRIKNDPAFKRTRENGQEFGEIARAGKLFRRALSDLIYNVKDRSITSRMMRVLAQVKNKDAVSDRGLRTVHLGLQTPEGKVHFNHFDFNHKAPLGQVLKVNYTLDTTADTLSIPDFVPLHHLALPQGVTHIDLQIGKLRFDFESGEGSLAISIPQQMEVDENPTAINLSVTSAATGPGLDYYFIKITFYQEINSKLYPLQNGAYNAMQLIAIE